MDNLSEFADEGLERAFRQTTYQVYGLDFAIRIGRSHPALDHWLTGKGYASWAFISAVNPGAERHSSEFNRQVHWAFEQALRSTVALYYPGAGIPDVPGWEAEPGFLIAGLSEAEALAIAARWRQRALVFGITGQPARLLWV